MGVLAEISMRAKLLRKRIRDNPDCVDVAIGELERLEDELFEAFREFEGEKKGA